MLVLNSLQVEPDEGAPWAIPAGPAGGGSGGASSGDGSEDGGGDGGNANGSDGEGVGSGQGPRRTHVWKGATPSQLPSLSGAALVGREVQVVDHDDQGLLRRSQTLQVSDALLEVLRPPRVPAGQERRLAARGLYPLRSQRLRPRRLQPGRGATWCGRR